MIEHDYPQGSEQWFTVRRGCITGSRFRDCRDKTAKGQPSARMLGYALDVARERCGGKAPAKFQTAAMRLGTEQEDVARRLYEARTGYLVETAGFFVTEDGMFGASPDGLIEESGVLEIKTMVSSETLFRAVADGDVSDYMDQCLGYLWLMGRQWVDLVLWVPDMNHLTIRRIERDENAIEALETDLMAFAGIVAEREAALRMKMGA